MKRSRWWLYGLLGIGVVALLIFGVRYVRTLAPPDELTIATGREEGAYYAFAQQYREEMAELGYTLNILPTAGSIDALRAVAAGEADVAFAEANAHVVAGVDSAEMATLASVFYEPMWVLYRADLTPAPTSLRDMEGLRIVIGEAGSGTREMATLLLNDNGITADNATLIELSPFETLDALKNGEIDVAFAVASPESAFGRQVATDPDVAIMSTERFRAYQSRYKNITVLTLGEGTIDLTANIPNEDKTLLATVATLVAGPTLHPDHARLLLGVATEVHREGGMLEQPGEFPSEALVTLPLSQDARNFLENGPTGIERYLPFWVASRLERILFIVVPLFVLFYPFFQSTPLAFTFFFRYRIFRWYQYVRSVEQDIEAYDLEEVEAKIAELRELQRELRDHMRVPVMYLADFYNLRLHINLVINRLNARWAHLSGEPLPPPEETVEWTSTDLHADDSPSAEIPPNSET